MALRDVFAGLTRKPTTGQYAKFMEGFAPIFSQFGHNVYASDVVQMCIDVIATECSKLRPKHIRSEESTATTKLTIPKSRINRLLRIAPNDLMTTKDFLEKIIWQLYMNYNCFIYPTYTMLNGRREYTGFYPLNPTSVTFIQDAADKLLVKLDFAGGESITVPYADIIHLRKKFSMNEIMGGGIDGQPDNAALLSVLQTNDIVLQGIGKAIKTSLAIRGIIKINTMADNEAQQAERARFEALMQAGNSGILPVDLKGDFTPINPDPKMIDKDTMTFLQDKILNYYGVSWPILSGDFSDEQYQAFYEKTLEPLIISLGQAFSKCLFTATELDFGNEIEFYPQKLLFTNVKNKIAVADILGNRGALTNNMLLEMFGYPPYEGGEQRYMSLNYVDVVIANEYQMTRAKVSGTLPTASGGGAKE